jgi:pentatricopeptide repeat-containing protein PET309
MTRTLFEADHTISHGDNDGSGSGLATGQSGSGPMFLDFLYPEKTKAMIRRLSVYGYRTWKKHMRSLGTMSVSRGLASQAAITRGVKTTSGADTEPGALSTSDVLEIPGVEALQKLKSLINLSERGEYHESWSQAWDYFHNLEKAMVRPYHYRGMIRILATSPRSRDWRRLLFMFEQMPKEERDAKSYFNAILFNLKFKRTDEAVVAHEEGLARLGPEQDVGTDILVAHLIARSEWIFLLRAWKDKKAAFRERNRSAHEWEESFENRIAPMPLLSSRVYNFMSTIEKDTMSKEDLDEARRLIVLLVNGVLKKGNSFGPNRNLEVLNILRQLGRARPYFYETLCLRTLNPTSQTLAQRMAAAHLIYRQYRQAGEEFQPSRGFLYSFISAAVEVKDMQYALVLLADWRTFYQDPPSSLTAIIIKGLAESGNIADAERMLNDFAEKQQGTGLNIKHFYPLLQFHAQRAAPESIKEGFDRIRAHSLKPDVVCWNILLNGYEKADQLDDVMVTLSSMIDAEIQPDNYTIGTVMAAAASRGDTELCINMLQMAESNGVSKTTIMHDCMVLAFLNDDRTSRAEEYATKVTETTPRLASTRMWNQIMTHHALNDAREVVVANTVRVASHMRSLNVPSDALSLACLLRAYVVHGKPDRARNILREKAAGKYPSAALHYAIVMDGYATMRQFEKGIRLHAEMVQRGVQADRNTKLALQRLQLASVKTRLDTDEPQLPGARTVVVDELLEELMPLLEGSQVPREPVELYSSHMSGPQDTAAKFLALPLSFYNSIRSFDVVEALLKRYEQLHTNATNDQAPLRLILQMMKLAYHEGKHSEVDRLWPLAIGKATATARLVSRADTNYLPASRRFILSRHVDIYLRSISARPEGNPTQIYATLQSLFDLGFDLDSSSWNLYVQTLATHYDAVTAFVLCEEHLMTTFPSSWRPNEQRVRLLLATRQKSPGTEFLGPRHTRIRRGELRAHYKTMVRFAFVLRKLKRERPYDVQSRRKLEEIERKAPMTVKAVMEMPMVEHPIATHVLGGRSGKGQRRVLNELQ